MICNCHVNINIGVSYLDFSGKGLQDLPPQKEERECARAASNEEYLPSVNSPGLVSSTSRPCGNPEKTDVDDPNFNGVVLELSDEVSDDVCLDFVVQDDVHAEEICDDVSAAAEVRECSVPDDDKCADGNSEDVNEKRARLSSEFSKAFDDVTNFLRLETIADEKETGDAGVGG